MLSLNASKLLLLPDLLPNVNTASGLDAGFVLGNPRVVDATCTPGPACGKLGCGTSAVAASGGINGAVCFFLSSADLILLLIAVVEHLLVLTRRQIMLCANVLIL